MSTKCLHPTSTLIGPYPALRFPTCPLKATLKATLTGSRIIHLHVAHRLLRLWIIVGYVVPTTALSFGF